MRILFLLFNQQDSVTEFSNNLKISLSWVDAMMEELVKCQDLEVALAVPVSSKVFQKSQKNGITIYGLPNPPKKNIFRKTYRRLIHARDTLTPNAYISRAVDDFGADIVQIFGSENYFGLVIRELKIPVVIHIQGYLLVWEGKWSTGISRWEQLRLANLMDLVMMRGCFNDFYYFRNRAATEAVILKNCKYFMGRTNFDRKIASLISPESNYFHCEEFIRQKFFENQWNMPLNNEIICISILKATSYKGINMIFEAAAVLRKYSVYKVSFKICGASDNDEIVKIIKKKYRKNKNGSDIEFLGKLSADALVDQLINSNFYIHPSYIENSPNSVCEAMALGMPVIATNVGGVSSLIEDEIEGMLVQEGEPYSLAGAIVELANDYDKARSLGSAARKTALKRHDPDHILHDLLIIYDKIINENGRESLSQDINHRAVIQ